MRWPKALVCGLVFFAVTSLHVQGQWYNPEKMPKKAQATYFEAIENLRAGAWEKGRSLLYVTLRQEPRFVEAWLSLMGAYGERKMYDSAVVSFEKAWQLDSIFCDDYLLPYSINLAGQGRFTEARDWVVRYLEKVPAESRAGRAAQFRKNTFDFAVAFAEKHRSDTFRFNPIHLGDSINSPRSEYYPSFTIDDSLLVFTRKMAGVREDFYSSRLRPDGRYTAAVPLPGALNEQPSKGGITMSPDGDWLFFAGNFGGLGFGDFDLYQCHATPQGWSEPFNVGGAVNTEFWESSPCISPDKQTLYFSSNRPGGYGGRDLYRSRRTPSGKWGPAENLGPVVNSAADDLAPFIHADNQTLFFTSAGHTGYGGSDIFVTRLAPGGEWQVPENVGYPINTIGDDGSLIVAANGTTAYFASFRNDSRGALDLYRFELPVYARAKKTQWVKGRVYDRTTGKGLPSTVEVTDLGSGTALNRLMTDETGQYLVTLPAGSDYAFTVSRKGYLYYSDRFFLALQPTDSNFIKDIPLAPIVAMASVEIKNIEFEINAATLRPSSFAELDKLAALLAENESLIVEISGHTDNTGNAADNLKLSQQRAKAVVDYLVAKGITATRMQAKGYGSSRPVADNKTEEGRARNRRTEMKVLGF